MKEDKIKLPLARRIPQKIVCNGIERVDEYAWLRSRNWKDVVQSPAVLEADIRKYIEAENEYTKALMVDTEPLQSYLFDEMKGRIEKDYQSVPNMIDNYAYYVRYQADKQCPIFCRHRTDIQQDEEILLDGNSEAEKYDYFEVGDLQQSPDHNLIAYTVDIDGSEFYSLYLCDPVSRNVCDQVIERTQGEVVWSNDSKYIFYVVLDDEHRPQEVCRHQLGTSVKDDVTVYKEGDRGFFVHLSETRSQRFITINVHAYEASECHLIDAHNPCAPVRLVRRRSLGIEYDIEHHRDDLLIRTNANQTEDYKLVRIPIEQLQSKWHDFYVPLRGVLLCLLYTSPSPRDRTRSRMPSSA